VGHTACMAEMRKADSIFVVKPDGTRHSEDLGVHERIILQCNLRIQSWKCGLGVPGSG